MSISVLAYIIHQKEKATGKSKQKSAKQNVKMNPKIKEEARTQDIDKALQMLRDEVEKL